MTGTDHTPDARVTDIHMHVLPGVDDGARTMEESCQMLRLAAEEGICRIFATPHCDAFLISDVRAVFLTLQTEARRQGIPVELYLGNEMRINVHNAGRCLRRLENGTFPTMGSSRCVLAEFDFETSPEGYFFCVDALQRGGYTPILAHLERFPNADLEVAKALHAAGALIQINAYSIANERNVEIRTRANLFLAERLVDFLGTDAHRLNHRPPNFRRGMEELKRLYTEDYARCIAVENPEKYLLGKS